MSHLLSGLLRFGDPLFLLEILAEAVLGSAIAFWLVRHNHLRAARVWRGLGFGIAIGVAAWAVFITTLHSTYAMLHISVPWSWAASALLIASSGTGLAGTTHVLCRRSSRSAMLSGSLAATGVSSMLFTAMAGVVQPFALAYDLTGVLVTALIGSALFGFALSEATNSQRRLPILKAVGLTATAIATICLGSMASILSFEGWMTAIAEPDDLSAAPLVIILSSEAALVLVLSLFGSLVDNRTAARDRAAISRLRELASSTFEAIVIHRDGVVLDGNDVLATLTGISLPAIVGQPMSAFCTAECYLENMVSGTANPLVSMEVRTVNGQPVPVEVLSRPITYAGQPAMVSALRDVRERRASEARIAFLAHHDVLTKLPNRAFLTETIALELERCAQNASSFSVLCLDLDGFKMVNDTMGHAAGDAVLCEVADRLRAHLRPGDFVARLGGDEFVILQVSAVETSKLARRLVEVIASPFYIEDRQIRIGVSIGIGVFPKDGTDAELLLRNADIALYSSKQEGRGIYSFFKPEMGVESQERAKMQQELQMALERNEVSLDFQPLFDVHGHLVSFEALMRWRHPEFGFVSPSTFIPIAEETDLIVTLGTWALQEACTSAVEWPKSYRVAVNVSARQLARSDLAQEVARILVQTGLPACCLELEITESALVANNPATLKTMQELSSLGVRLALDDFGTGFSSLSYLHRFPFQKLKIDRSFAQRLPEDRGASLIINTIVAMALGLELKVTAEGVETIDQLNVLRAKGVHEFQGYFLCKPLSSCQMATFLLEHQNGIYSVPGAEMVVMPPPD